MMLLYLQCKVNPIFYRVKKQWAFIYFLFNILSILNSPQIALRKQYNPINIKYQILITNEL